MRKPSYKLTYFCLFIVGCLVLSLVAYIQYIHHSEPCLLCILQRIILFFLTLIFLATSLHNHNTISKKIYNIISLTAAILGLIVSGRQIWLQLFAKNPQHAYCIPNYRYLDIPLWRQLLQAFTGAISTSCAETTWRFLKISMAGWSFLFFAMFCVVILWQWKR